MRRSLIVMSAALSASIPGLIQPAGAQTAEELRKARGRWETPSSAAGFSAQGAFGGWSVVAIFTEYDRSTPFPNGRPTPWWIARRTAAPPGGAATVSWADSKTCPQLGASLARMATLTPPRPRVWGLDPYLPVTPPGDILRWALDGTTYTVWSADGVQPDNTLGSVEFSSNSGLIADWGEATFKRLEPCWRAEAPAAEARPSSPPVGKVGQRRRAGSNDPFPPQPPPRR